MFTKIGLLLASFLLLGGENSVFAAPAAPKVVLKFEATPSVRHSPTATLPYVENPLGWTNDEIWSLFSQDNCFTLSLASAQPNVTIRADFRFDPSDVVTRTLFRHGGGQQTKQFCLDQYIYLNRMKSYQLELGVEGVVLQPFEVTLEQHSGNWTFVQEPDHATISGGWLFFNDQFDYSFFGPHKEEPQHFELCDQIANCFRYHPIRDPLKPEQVLYAITEKDLKTLSGTTPFVRIHSDDGIENAAVAKAVLDKQYHLNYNNAQSESLKRVHTLYPASVINSTTNSLTFTRTFNRKFIENRLRLTLPLDAVDHRIQEIKAQLTIRAPYNNSYIELVGVNKSGVSAEAAGFKWPNAGIQADGEFTISTRNFIAMGPADQAKDSFTGQYLTAEFEIDFDYDFEQLEVDVNISVAHSDLVYRTQGGFIENYPKQMWHDNPIWDHQDELKWTAWRYVANLANGSDWIYRDKLQLNLTDRSIEDGKKINAENLQVKRVILGSRGNHLSIVPLKLNFNSNGTESWFDEPILNSELPQTEEYFRQGYLILSGDYALNEMMGVNVHIHLHDHIFDDDNCKHEPTFGTLVCHNELYQCPAYFKYNAEKGFCQLIQA